MLSPVDHPYRPLLLEMALVGLSRWAIEGLLMTSFKENVTTLVGGKKKQLRFAVEWKERNHSMRFTRLSTNQWLMAQEYLRWRNREVYIKSACLFVATPPGGINWQPMKGERARSEIRSMGKDCYVSEQLEIPTLHRSMANVMRMQGISEEGISEFYGKKSYKSSHVPAPE
jgi:hypothetical protein